MAVLAAAFLAWMFAGFEIALFVLVHRQMSLELLGAATPESTITTWFAWYQAAFLFGAAAGGWLFGFLGDRFGRTHALAASVYCFSLFTGACYFTGNAEVMLVLRFLACLGIGGVWPNAVALVSEAWPNASRPLLAGVLGAAANVGMVLLGVLGYYFTVAADEWRWIVLVASTPALLGVVLHFAIPESPRWLRDRAMRADAPNAVSPVREVFRPPLLQRTLIGIALGAIPVVGSAANANWLVPWTDHAHEQSLPSGEQQKPKSDPRQKARTMITRSGGAVFGSLLGGIVANWLGRRLSYFLISLGAFAASTVLFSQLDPHHPWFQFFTFLLGFVGITYFGWLPLFLPELFPTPVRSTGTGIAFNTGRVVAGIVVLSAGFLLTQFGGDYARVGFWSGTIYIAGMIVIWFVPRQSGRLED